MAINGTSLAPPTFAVGSQWGVTGFSAAFQGLQGVPGAEDGRRSKSIQTENDQFCHLIKAAATIATHRLQSIEQNDHRRSTEPHNDNNATTSSAL